MRPFSSWEEYLESFLLPSEDAWPFKEPFPLDVELAKYNKTPEPEAHGRDGKS